MLFLANLPIRIKMGYICVKVLQRHSVLRAGAQSLAWLSSGYLGSSTWNARGTFCAVNEVSGWIIAPSTF